jgi:outer membrane protein OmpA-like peptidoglycan-associated protein
MMRLRPRHIRVGCHHLLIEGSRVWVCRSSIDLDRLLGASLEERKRMKHVSIGSEMTAQRLADRARFLSQDEARQLGSSEEFSGRFMYEAERIVSAILGNASSVHMVMDARPRNDPPRPRHPPFVPPQPLDPGGPTKLRDKFVYDVRLVDELGEPIDDVLLRVAADSPPMRTDGDGRIRYEFGSSSNALARFPDPKGLREALRPRWEQIREGDWLTEDAEHTYIDAADPLPMVRVRSDRLQTIVVQPRVICARILELLFDTNKTFLLPSALEHIRAVRKLYDKRPRAELLIVGHTDTTGDPDVNDPLSLNRARSIKAYLTDDVETWLDFYGGHMHANARWGPHEDHLMLDAVLAATGEEVTDTRVRHFQSTRGLEPDGKLGENTRRALTTEYMAADGTTLPKGIQPVIHGCGANFPLEPDDPPDHTHDRRVELFFFDPDLGILPPPPGELSPPGSVEYPEWRRRLAETHDFIARGGGVEVAIRVCDDNLEPMPGAVCTIEGFEIIADDQAFVVLPLGIAGETAVLQWHAPLPPAGEQPPDDGFEADDEPDIFERQVFVRFPDGEEGARRKLHNLGYDHDQPLKTTVAQYQQDFELETTGELADIQESLDTWHDGGNQPGPAPPSLEAASPETLDAQVGKKRATAATRLRPLLVVRVSVADGTLVDPALLEIEAERLDDEGKVAAKLTETGRGGVGGTLDVEFSRTLRKIHEIRTHLRRADGTTVTKETRRVKVRAAKILANKKSIIEVQLAVPKIRDATKILPAKTIPDGGDQSYVAVPLGPLIGTVSHIWQCTGSAAIDGSAADTVVKVKADSVSSSVGDTTLMVTQTETGFPVTRDVRIMSRISIEFQRLTVYKVDDVSIDLENTKCLRTGVAAPSIPLVLSTDDRSFATTQITVVQGAGDIELEATVRPPGVPISWQVERAADDVAGLGGLPTDAPNGATNKHKVTADATGSFHIHAFVDDDRDEKRGPKEGGVIVNLVMVRIDVSSDPDENEIIVNDSVFTDSLSNTEELRIDSGKTGGTGPAVNASYDDKEFKKHVLAMKVTVELTGGGPDGRRGVSSVGLGYIQHTPSNSIKATYADGREVKEVVVIDESAPNPITSGVFPLLAFPVRDTISKKSSGIDPFINSSSDAEQADLAQGQSRVVRFIDPPAIILPRRHPVTNSPLATFTGSNDFDVFLCAFSHDYDENYVVLATASWSITYGVFSAAVGWTSLGAGVETTPSMTVHDPPLRGDASGVEHCPPNFVDNLKMDAT